MAGMTFEKMTQDRARHEKSGSRRVSSANCSSGWFPQGNNEFLLPPASLTDPLVQDFNHASRKHLFYFASNVCRDLVLYDVPEHNSFRELIPLTHQHPVLLQVIIANSALRMSNAC